MTKQSALGVDPFNGMEIFRKTDAPVQDKKDTVEIKKPEKISVNDIEKQQEDILHLEKDTTDKLKDLKSTKKNLKKGYSRQTYAMRDDNIEKLKAVAWYNRKEIKTVINEAVDLYFSDKPELVEKALKEYAREGISNE